ncbi:MAG: DUF4383 domain-containing protein [Rhodospirillales bacterium]|nr:DUF4383 domain-containing protein [Rhodospirillales bacterium]
MRTRYFALVFGIAFLAAGILGFIPQLLTPPIGAPPLRVNSFYGVLLGLFPVNVLHNLVHILLGLWGLAAWRSFPAARNYARGVAVIYAVLAVFGLIPGLATLFGLVPLFGHDIWLHAVSAAIAAYFGWAPMPAASPATTVPPGDTTYRR